MASTSEDGDLRAMRVSAEQTALKDEVYYWLDNARFLVSPSVTHTEFANTTVSHGVFGQLRAITSLYGFGEASE